jgi:hypothetical protein
MPKTPVTAIRIPDDVREWAEEEGRKAGVSMAGWLIAAARACILKRVRVDVRDAPHRGPPLGPRQPKEEKREGKPEQVEQVTHD